MAHLLHLNMVVKRFVVFHGLKTRVYFYLKMKLFMSPDGKNIGYMVKLN